MALILATIPSPPLRWNLGSIANSSLSLPHTPLINRYQCLFSTNSKHSTQLLLIDFYWHFHSSVVYWPSPEVIMMSSYLSLPLPSTYYLSMLFAVARCRINLPKAHALLCSTTFNSVLKSRKHQVQILWQNPYSVISPNYYTFLLLFSHDAPFKRYYLAILASSQS